LEAYTAQQRDCEMLHSKHLISGVVKRPVFGTVQTDSLSKNAEGCVSRTSFWNWPDFAILGARQRPVAVPVPQQPAGLLLGS